MTICIERQKELLAEQAVVVRNKVCIHEAENGTSEINVNVSSGRGGEGVPSGDEILSAAWVFWASSFTATFTEMAFGVF